MGGSTVFSYMGINVGATLYLFHAKSGCCKGVESLLVNFEFVNQVC